MKDTSRIMCMLFVTAAFVGCSQSPAGAPFTPQPTVGLTPSGEHLHTGTGFQAIIASSHLVIGRNRFALGLIDNDGAVKDAQVHLKFFDLNSGRALLKGEAGAPFYGDNLGDAGVYVTRTNFDAPGKWGVEVNAARPNQQAQIARVGFLVAAKDTIPNRGDQAPRSRNVTLADVGHVRSKICSAVEDDGMLHELSVASALASGKPAVILFATPGFCTSRTCGPNFQVVKELQSRYGDKANFIHVEVYKDFQTFEVSDAMKEWYLDTEPWLFFVDKDGKIADRFQGGITTSEIEPELVRLIGVASRSTDLR